MSGCVAGGIAYHPALAGSTSEMNLLVPLRIPQPSGNQCAHMRQPLLKQPKTIAPAWGDVRSSICRHSEMVRRLRHSSVSHPNVPERAHRVAARTHHRCLRIKDDDESCGAERPCGDAFQSDLAAADCVEFTLADLSVPVWRESSVTRWILQRV